MPRKSNCPHPSQLTEKNRQFRNRSSSELAGRKCHTQNKALQMMIQNQSQLKMKSFEVFIYGISYSGVEGRSRAFTKSWFMLLQQSLTWTSVVNHFRKRSRKMRLAKPTRCSWMTLPNGSSCYFIFYNPAIQSHWVLLGASETVTTLNCHPSCSQFFSTTSFVCYKNFNAPLNGNPR